MTANNPNTLGFDPNGVPYVTLIFTYGTLMRGYGNYKNLLTTARFMGEAITSRPDYDMYVVYGGAFPLAVASAFGRPGSRVRGEVFAVTERVLEECDCLEGHPVTYKRELVAVDVFGATAEPITAWMYLYQRGNSNRERVAPRADGTLKWSRAYD